MNLFTKPNQIENEKVDKYESAKDLFLKWTETLTIHAIPNIFRTRHLLIKIIWMISFLISTGLCAYMVYGSINNYLQFNVVTTIRNIREPEMVFPSVSICNLNPFVTESSFQFVYEIAKSSLGIDLYDILNENSTSSLIQNSKYKLSERYLVFNYFLKQIIANPALDKQRENFGFSFNKFVISCFYAYSSCYENDFVSFYDLTYGSCFKFNSGKLKNGSNADLKKVTYSGKNFGLMLELFVGDASDPRSFSTNAGAHIFIHNDSVTPKSYEGLDLNVGMTTNIALHKTYTSKLPIPYSDCTDELNDINSYDSEYYRIIMNTNYSYTQSDCFDLCYQKSVMNQCDCYDGSIGFFDRDQHPCTNSNETSCQIEIYLTFFNMGYEKLCANQCPLECHSTSYSSTASYSVFPTMAYAYSLIKDKSFLSRFENSTNVNYETIKQNILSVNIYFDRLESTTIQEGKQTEFVDLVAGIGGTLGLFLGVSVLSLFEVVEVLLEILLSIKNKQKSNRIESVN